MVTAFRCFCDWMEASGRNDAVAATPLENSLLPFLRDFNSELLHPGFFTGNDVKDRIASADERFNVLLEIHRTAR